MIYCYIVAQLNNLQRSELENGSGRMLVIEISSKYDESLFRSLFLNTTSFGLPIFVTDEGYFRNV